MWLHEINFTVSVQAIILYNDSQTLEFDTLEIIAPSRRGQWVKTFPKNGWQSQ